MANNRIVFQRLAPNSSLVVATNTEFTPDGRRVQRAVKLKANPIIEESTAVNEFNGIIEEAANANGQMFPRKQFQSAENNALLFTIDMTDATIEAGETTELYLGLGDFFETFYPSTGTLEQKVHAKAVITHHNHPDSFGFINTLAAFKHGIELQELYMDVVESGSQRQYPPEVYEFDLFGQRVINSLDKKKYQDKTAQDTDKSVLRIDNLRVHLNGLTGLKITVPKGEKSTFRFKYKTEY